MEGNQRQILSQMIQPLLYPEMYPKPRFRKSQWALSTFEECYGQDSIIVELRIHSLKKFLFCFICKSIEGLFQRDARCKDYPQVSKIRAISIVSPCKENMKRDVLWPPLLKITNLFFDILTENCHITQ